MRELVVATRNKDKAREMKRILKDFPVRVLSLKSFKAVPEVVEDGDTFKYNAAKKARAVSKHTKRLAIADDSGLMVRALKGNPGVKSARFAGKEAIYLDNNLKLLALLGGLPFKKRDAKFVCVIAIADRGRVLKTVTGTVKGHISFVMKGRNGFGYDPVFIPVGKRKTFAEMSPVAKNRISHRYRALAKARQALKKYL